MSTNVTPKGDIAIQTIAMPADANWYGDIFGGWLMSQMDLAGAVKARELAKGRVATIAVEQMAFLNPVPVGALVSCYASVINKGRTSLSVLIEVWITHENLPLKKVTEGRFVYVAIDQQGNKRELPA